MASSSLVVRGTHFRRVWNGSGARGFAGEGYWWHDWVPGLDYRGSTFVAKTTTLSPRAGNMPLGPSWKPKELFPSCIVVKPFDGLALNSVGLSGPGVRDLVDAWNGEEFSDGLGSGSWLFSLMSVEPTGPARLGEIQEMCGVVSERGLPGHPGLQVNISCPNVGLDPGSLVEEAARVLDVVGALGLPTFLKVNVLFPIEAVRMLSEHEACDGFVCSNTIPWGKLPELIDWSGIFGSDESPLAHIGGGGLSGAVLLPLVEEWIYSVRDAGVTSVVVGGGGVLDEDGASALLDAGADAVELGSVSFLRPWRVSSIIRSVDDYFPEECPDDDGTEDSDP